MAGPVYWQGADGNVYLKSANGVQKYTSGSGFSDAGFQGLLNGVQGQSVQATRIADPNPPKVASSSASGSSAPQIDQAKIAEYDQGIRFMQDAVNRLGAQEQQGYSTIDSSWQNALNTLLGDKNQAEAGVTSTKSGLAKQFVTAKNTVGANAGNTLGSLLALLGARGAGGSSAARVVAPGLVTRNATQQRGELASTNAENLRGIDQNWGDYLHRYQNEVNSANNQRTNKRGELAGTIANSRGTLLQQIAELAGQRSKAAGGSATGGAAPYLAAANNAYNSALSYRVNPVAYNTQAYNAPELEQYLVDPGGAPQVQGGQQTNDYTSPYYAALLGNNKKQQNTAA